jgi:hypothetical protein
MPSSILTDTKKILGIVEEDTTFDPDILIHINTVFSVLNSLGIGPTAGFIIEDKTPTWEDYLGTDLNLSSVKTYIYLRVRIFFDPPASSFVLTAMQEQIRELEWRLNVEREHTQWVDPDPNRPTLSNYYCVE